MPKRHRHGGSFRTSEETDDKKGHLHQPTVLLEKDTLVTQPPERQRVSVKDLAVLVSLATLTASALVTIVFGYDNLLQKCYSWELTYVLATLVLFAIAICIITYILLRLTAHYLIYVGIGVLLAIIYPCHPSRVRGYLQHIFDRPNARKQRTST